MIERRLTCHLMAAIFCAVFIFPFVWMIVDDAPPIILDEGYTIPEIVIAGEEYFVNWNTTIVRSECTGKIHRTVIDSEGTLWLTEVLPSLFVDLDIGKSTRATGRSRIMQSGIPAGPAKILTRGEFQCSFFGIPNPIQGIWPIRKTFPEIKTMIKNRDTR